MRNVAVRPDRTGAAATIRRWATWIERHAGRLAAVVVALNLIVGLAYAASLGSKVRYFDEREYLQLAQNVADGHGYSRSGVATVYRPPAWPVLLGVLRWVGFGTTMLRMVNAVLLALTLVL